ncbi:MAG TPA: hypothetical protein EYP04_02405 [Anaerolineae bacterium]|nr:hypothetical protein [Anaerolineae bacterium]
MSTEKYIRSLSTVAEDDIAQVGGKAAHLGALVQAGLPVPAAFCVTTDAYWAFLSHNSLSDIIQHGTPAKVRTAIRAAEIPPTIVEAVATAYANLAAQTQSGPTTHFAIAVRSSATMEDTPDASFAGQFDTYLNVVGLEQLLNGMKACWASLWAPHAIAYAQQQGIAPNEATMGVIVQQQIPAQASGVLFTLNPVTGREEEMVVEAVWGLGQALVSGRLSPDIYVVDAYRRQVLEQEIAQQRVVLLADARGGLREQPLPPEQTAQPVLSEEQLLRLAELGCQVQEVFGYPQDVEWALAEDGFAVLQSRPLTSIQFDPAMGLWTSANYREVMPGFPSPLTISISLLNEYGEALSEFFREIKMGEATPGTVWGRMIFGRPYWNLGEVKRFASLIPGYKERTFDRTVGIEPAYEGDGQTTPWTPRTVLRALPILFALKKQYATCWQKAQAYRDWFLNEEEPAIAAIDPATLDDRALYAWVRRMFDLHWTTNKLAITVSLLSTQAQDDFEPLLRKLNNSLPPEERIAEGDLITGMTGVSTAQPTLELWKLARQALAHPGVATAITEGDPLGIPERLQMTAAGRAYWIKLQDLIQRYRYMSEVDEDLGVPRWDEDPSFVLTTLQAYAQADESLNPERQLREQIKIREEAERRAMAALSRGWRRWWPFPRRSFTSQLELMRRYIWWREEMRVVASRAFYHCRRFFLELGRRWAAQGLLEEPEHIFLLYQEHVLAGLEGKLTPEEAQSFVRNYLRMKRCYRNFKPPGVIGAGVCITEPAAMPAQARLQGIPCSSGQATGQARVALNLEEAQALRRGEVLVAPYTNPGWTPLFNLASAIVIEEGGLLSHGAVVAREYGIPAVVRVEKATQMLQTGQLLRVDGATGTVEVIKQNGE